jgi:hypothetical protein
MNETIKAIATIMAVIGIPLVLIGVGIPLIGLAGIVCKKAIDYAYDRHRDNWEAWSMLYCGLLCLPIGGAFVGVACLLVHLAGG